MIKTTIKLAALAAVISSSFAGSAYALDPSNISKIVIFGDSLSDTNYQNTLSLTNGKTRANWTTPGGYVWAHYLVQNFGKGPLKTNNENAPAGNQHVSNPPVDGNDYAAGGAVTSGDGIGFSGYKPPSVNYQVTQYLTKYHDVADANALYIIWVGSNNFLKPFVPKSSVEKTETVRTLIKKTENGAQDIANEVSLLHSKGARHILVINLPNLGATPLVNKNLLASKSLELASSLFNSDLKKKLEKTGVPIALFDVNKLMNEVVSTVKKDGAYHFNGLTIDNAVDSACPMPEGSYPMALSCKPAANTQHYLFADVAHPSGVGHHIMAEKIEAFIKATDF